MSSQFQFKGQSIVEYLLLFAVLALVTVFAVGLLPDTRQTAEQHFQIAVQRITAP